MEVGYGRVMAGMLTVYLGPILVQSLVSLPKYGVEWLLLFDRTVETCQCEGYHQLESLQFIVGLSGLLEKDRRESVPVADPFEQTPWLEYSYGQGYPNDALAGEDIGGCLLNDVFYDSLLLIQDLLIHTLETILVLEFQAMQDFILLIGELTIEGLIGDVGRWGDSCYQVVLQNKGIHEGERRQQLGLREYLMVFATILRCGMQIQWNIAIFSFMNLLLLA